MIFLAKLFKLTRKFQTKFKKLNLLIQSISGQNSTEKNKSFSFPWWFKIFLYVLCFLIMGVSIFLTVIKGKKIIFHLYAQGNFFDFRIHLGIQFGNQQVKNWLVSFAVSVLIGILMTQPLQVGFRMKRSIFFSNKFFSFN